MKIHKLSVVHILILLAVLTVLVPLFSPESFSVYAQGGNSVTGYVYGLNRTPLENIQVELLDDFNRTFDRKQTNGSGFYSFHNMGAGRYTVRVSPFGTDYEEQDQSIEIINITRQTNDSGSLRVGGFENVERDFYMKLRKGVTATTGLVFAQTIPEEAKKLYDKAVDDLTNKKEKEGLLGLRQAIEIFPNYYLALERLGREYVSRGSLGKQYFEAAEILLVNAAAVNPKAYLSWYGLAYSQYSLNKYDAASASVLKALEIYPNYGDALLLNGILLRQAKKFEEAEKQLLKAKEFSRGTNPYVHWHLALLYGIDLKRYSDAAKELKLFLKAQPDSKYAEQIKKQIAEYEAKAAEKN